MNGQPSKAAVLNVGAVPGIRSALMAGAQLEYARALANAGAPASGCTPVGASAAQPASPTRAAARAAARVNDGVSGLMDVSSSAARTGAWARWKRRGSEGGPEPGPEPGREECMGPP